MRVLFVTSEIYPYVKTGGLGDVSAALPPALKKAGADVRFLVPGYPAILEALSSIKIVATFPVYFGAHDARLLHGVLPDGMPTYVLDAEDFFSRSGPYVDTQGKDWVDNHYRFAALSRVAADLGDLDRSWQPEIIHSHDWPGGLVPLYLKYKRGPRPKSLITIHNIAYQGLFPAHLLPLIGLPPESFATDGVEYYNQIGYLKAGLVYADRISTVSPTYAEEVQTKEHGCGLDGLLCARSHVLSGILNGIDTEVWNPKTDENLTYRYDTRTVRFRGKNKAALLAEYLPEADLDQPLYAVVSRFGYQKGLDLLAECAPSLLKSGANLFLLGSGDADIERAFARICEAYPEQARLVGEYNEPLAHRLQSSSDIVVMPSRSEPCGLVQMYAMRYGAVPLVRKTGGLADTVKEENPETGFVFQGDTPHALQQCLSRSKAAFEDKARWKKLQKNGMTQDFSWDVSAKEYLKLYSDMIKSA